ncbi:MAG: hypothetical protein ACRDPM_12095 [Solirubrobacteraceae bacterium]
MIRRPLIGAIIVLGLLVWWPLVILALVVIVPALAISAVVAAVVAAIVAPTWPLVRRVRAHHARLHGAE